MVNLASMRTKDGHLHQHALDVAITCTMIGTASSSAPGHPGAGPRVLPHGPRYDHRASVPCSRKRRRSPFRKPSSGEHPAVGFAILRANEGVPINTAHVAYQHHERLDGRGFPRQLKAADHSPQKTLRNAGGHIHRYAQIAAVADTYLGAINPRPGPAIPSRPSRRMRMMIDEAGKRLNSHVVNALITLIPVFPRGTRIDGREGPQTPPGRHIGVVSKANPVNKDAPGDPAHRQVQAPHQAHPRSTCPGKKASKSSSPRFKGLSVPPRRIVPAGRKTLISPMLPAFSGFRWGRLQAMALCLLAFSACSRGKEIARAPPPSVPERTLIPERRAPIPERTLQVTAAAYNSTVAQTDSRPAEAAWGDSLVPGMRAIAISRDLIPLGLGQGVTVRIEGLPGEYTVLDKMDARWRKRIYVYFGKDVAAARQWGEKQVVIRWLDTGSWICARGAPWRTRIPRAIERAGECSGRVSRSLFLRLEGLAIRALGLAIEVADPGMALDAAVSCPLGRISNSLSRFFFIAVRLTGLPSMLCWKSLSRSS